ncbi:MAG TPA: hypothetical protein VFI38_13360 [Candidatus Acidoferrum sp.]|nr:hypothetical protein [Candidatus Acidoferrum sp.]
MSWYDGALSNTVGVVWRAASGTVDPWTLQGIKDDANADIAQASGPNADPAQVAINQAQTSSEIDLNLVQEGAHPDQAGIRIPGLGNIGSADFLAKAEKIVYGLIFVGAAVGALWLYQSYGSIVKGAFRKR